MKIKSLTIFALAGTLGLVGYRHFQHVHELTQYQRQQRLIDAVERSDYRQVIETLQSGIDINRPIFGRLPLIAASEKGNAQIVELLVRKGADVNLALSPGDTALFAAVRKGNSALIDYLLRAGADPGPRLPNGWTPLHSLAYNGRVLDLKNLLSYIKAGSGKVDPRDKHGITPLMYASEKGHIEIIRLLLRNGANPNAQSNTGMTPLLFLACSRTQYLKAALDLIKGGANANLVDKDGMSPLMAAAYRNHEALAALLQSKGADNSLRNKVQKTAADIAGIRGNRRIASYLK